MYSRYSKRRKMVILRSDRVIAFCSALAVGGVVLSGLFNLKRENKIEKGFKSGVLNVGELVDKSTIVGSVVYDKPEKGNMASEKKLLNFIDGSVDFKKSLSRPRNVLGADLVVKLSVGGKDKILSVVPGLKVSELLQDQGIDLSAEDLVNFNADDEVKDCMRIVVNRVCHKENFRLEKIGFGSKTETTDELFEGEVQKKVTGAEGELKITFREKFVDGKLVEQKEVARNVLKPPVEEVILKGCKKRTKRSCFYGKGFKFNGVPSFDFENGGLMPVTAYCDKGRTATGALAGPGCIAVDFKICPPGTRLEIIDPKTGKVIYSGTANDTGCALRNGSAAADVHMPNEQSAMNFGRKYCLVRKVKSAKKNDGARAK